jgi:hypothetical protein
MLMPLKFHQLIFAFFLLISFDLSAQKITYSDPAEEDSRQLTEYEIVGKIAGNILVYKKYRDDHYIAVYDQQMKLTAKEKLEKMPDKLINTDFINYPDYAYMIYQYQKKSTVYCVGQKIDAQGKAIGEPIEMDTTHINFWASNKVYNSVVSDDKQRIGVFKLNTKNEKLHILTTCVFDKDLKLINKHRINVPMPGKYDYLTEFAIDNTGDIVFLRASSASQSEDEINKVQLIFKPVNVESISEYEVNLDLEKKTIYLDDLKIRADNANSRFLVSSYYSKTRRGNVDGMFSYLWDKKTRTEVSNSKIPFSDDFRTDAKGNNTTKTAFNDYFLRNIVMRADGGYIITAEAIYSTTRGGNPYNRYDYIYGSPYAGDFVPIGTNPYLYPWWRLRNSNQTTRFYADNIMVLSFNDKGVMEWSNVVRKSQYDDNNDSFLGYNMINTGSELHFIFNQQEKRTLMLSDQSIEPSGQITRRPTLRNLDKGFDFMPRYGKQISAKTIIFPCQYRNYICFAKVEF